MMFLLCTVFKLLCLYKNVATHRQMDRWTDRATPSVKHNKLNDLMLRGGKQAAHDLK